MDKPTIIDEISKTYTQLQTDHEIAEQKLEELMDYLEEHGLPNNEELIIKIVNTINHISNKYVAHIDNYDKSLIVLKIPRRSAFYFGIGYGISHQMEEYKKIKRE